MSKATTWNEMKKPDSGDLRTVSSKNCPMQVVFFPDLGVYELDLFYDETIKQSRMPRAGEKSRRRVLVPGAFVDGNKLVAKALLMPPTVAFDVRTVMQAAQAVDPGAVMLIEITSTGSGLATKYNVVSKRSLPKDKTSALLDVVKKINIQAVIDRLEGRSTPSVQLINDIDMNTSTPVEIETEEDTYADLEV